MALGLASLCEWADWVGVVALVGAGAILGLSLRVVVLWLLWRLVLLRGGRRAGRGR